MTTGFISVDSVAPFGEDGQFHDSFPLTRFFGRVDFVFEVTGRKE